MSLNSRLEHEAVIAGQKMPPGTEPVRVDGVIGWMFAIESELGDRYTMMVYFNGSGYDVQVVDPPVAGTTDPHRIHVLHDGRICFNRGTCLPSLEEAYGKACLWANGYSVFEHTGAFPF